MKLNNKLLKRYWLIISPENPYGTGNFGVTAYSENEAIEMISASLQKLNRLNLIPTLSDKKIIEDIDITLLDENHVIPNMGIVSSKGVWFPNLNYYQHSGK